jgi:3-hydroxyisobutyrate dehydrogenase
MTRVTRMRLHRPGQHGRRHGRQPGQGAARGHGLRPVGGRGRQGRGGAGCSKAGSVAEAVKDAEVGDHHAAGRARTCARSTPSRSCRTRRKSALLIDCSTIDVDSARAVAEPSQGRGLPIRRRAGVRRHGGGGGGNAGLHGRLRRGGFRRCGGCDLAPMSRATIRAGDHGAGQAAKICNNMVLGASMIGVCEAFALAEKLGLEAGALLRDRLQVLRPVLEPDQLLPVARPGAHRAVESQLRGRIRGGDDAEGPETGAGGGGQGRGGHAAGRPGRKVSTPCSTAWAAAAKDFSAILEMLRGQCAGLRLISQG